MALYGMTKKDVLTALFDYKRHYHTRNLFIIIAVSLIAIITLLYACQTFMQTLLYICSEAIRSCGKRMDTSTDVAISIAFAYTK